MRSAARAFYRVKCHSMTVIDSLRYFVRGQRRIETGPAGSRFKLRTGTEQLTSASGTEIAPFLMIVPICILVWRLCFGFSQDLKLAGSQDLSPLLIIQCHLLRRWSRLDLPPDSSRLCVFCHAEVSWQHAEQKQG